MLTRFDVCDAHPELLRAGRQAYHAPLVGQGNIPEISHYFGCYTIEAGGGPGGGPGAGPAPGGPAPAPGGPGPARAVPGQPQLTG